MSVEEVLDFKAVPDDRRVPLVATRLRGRALAWWQQSKHLRVRQGKNRIDSWLKFKEHVQREFLPFNYSRLLYQRLQHLRQGSRSIDTYTEEFYQLLVRNDLLETNDQIVSRYIGGLRLQFQDTLNMFSPATVSEAHQRALLLEKQLNRRPPSTYNPTDHSVRDTMPTQTTTPPKSAPVSGPSRPFVPPVGSTRPGAYFSCGATGHRQANCPKAATSRALLIDDATDSDYTSPAIYDEEIEPLEQEVRLQGDIGQLLVSRRICLAPLSATHDEQ